MWVGLKVITQSKMNPRQISPVSLHMESEGGRTGRSQTPLGLRKEKRDRKEQRVEYIRPESLYAKLLTLKSIA